MIYLHCPGCGAKTLEHANLDHDGEMLYGCKSCGQKYRIDWKGPHFPTVLGDDLGRDRETS